MRFARLAIAVTTPLALAATTGCSDPVPPTPQGAWAVSFQPQDSDAIKCMIAGHNAAIGSINANTRTAVVADGTDGAQVSCSVTGSTKFNIDAQAQQAGSGLHIIVNNITAAATEMAPVLGNATFASDKTSGLGYSSSDPNNPCQFYFTPMSGEGVASGRVWVAFKCPAVIEGMSTCQIKQGYAIFENCTQQE